MKNKKRLILISFGLGMFFCTIAPIIVNAQDNSPKAEIDKHEISLDLLQFFSDGIPNKVLFKVNTIKEEQVKGALRFGLDFNYKKTTYEVTQNNHDYTETSNFQSGGFGFTFGYEIQKKLKNIIFYYGADLGTHLSRANEKVVNMPGDNNYSIFSIVPFIGVKAFISKNASISMETGWDNFIAYNKDSPSTTPGNKVKNHMYSSKLSIPYSLTINYKF